MSRKTRIHINSGTYHVMLRGTNLQNLFHEKVDYPFFLVKWSGNNTTLQTFSGWFLRHKKTKKWNINSVPVFHVPVFHNSEIDRCLLVNLEK